MEEPEASVTGHNSWEQKTIPSRPPGPEGVEGGGRGVAGASVQLSLGDQGRAKARTARPRGHDRSSEMCDESRQSVREPSRFVLAAGPGLRHLRLRLNSRLVAQRRLRFVDAARTAAGGAWRLSHPGDCD